MVRAITGPSLSVGEAIGDFAPVAMVCGAGQPPTIDEYERAGRVRGVNRPSDRFLPPVTLT